MLKRLWLDEGGAVLTTELILLICVLIIGIGAGLVVLRDAVIAELAYVGQAIVGIDASYCFPGVQYTDATGGAGVHQVIYGALFDDSVTVADPAAFDYATVITGDTDPTVVKTTETATGVGGA